MQTQRRLPEGEHTGAIRKNAVPLTCRRRRRAGGGDGIPMSVSACAHTCRTGAKPWASSSSECLRHRSRRRVLPQPARRVLPQPARQHEWLQSLRTRRLQESPSVAVCLSPRDLGRGSEETHTNYQRRPIDVPGPGPGVQCAVSWNVFRRVHSLWSCFR